MNEKPKTTEASHLEVSSNALPVGWKEITVTVSPQMEEELKGLVSTGHFGLSIEDAAERVLAADLHQRTMRR